VPADGATLTISGAALDPVEITGFDALGRRVFARTLPATTTQLALPEIGKWPAGAYSVLVRQGTRQTALRLLRP
jgi:hypothetical protein